MTACVTEPEPSPEPEDRAGVAPSCEPVDLDPRRAIFETNVEVLAPFTMRTILRRAAKNAGYAPTPVNTYRRIIDTYATADQGSFPQGQHCDDEAPDPAFTDPDGCGLLGCDQTFFCAAHDQQCFSCNGDGTVCLDPGFPPGSHEVCSFDGSGQICTFDGDVISDCQPVVGDECDDAGCHPLGCDAVSMCDPTFELCVVCTAELEQCEVIQGTADEAVELVCNATDMCELDVAAGTVSGCEPDPVCEEAQCGPLGCNARFLCTENGEVCFLCSDDGQTCDLFGQEVPSPSQVCSFDTGEVCTFEQGTVGQCGPDTEGICFGGGDDGGFDTGGFISGGGSDGGDAEGGFDSGGFVGDGGEVTGFSSITATSDGGTSFGGTSFGGTSVGDSFGDTSASDDGIGDDGIDTDGDGDGGGQGFGGMNGYPLECPRVEAAQIDNIDAWFPISISNRFDLAPDDGAHCGQQRIVLANNSQGRMFMIFEAQIPNPYPECGLEACRPIVEFWAHMNEIENPKQRRKELVRAFLQGHPDLESRGFGPFVNADHYSFGTGQVRTNNFDDFPWTLREFKLVPSPNGSKVRAVQVPVVDSPVGDHFNDALDTPLGPECRESFLSAIDGLLTDEPNAMSFPIAPECRAAESRDDFVSNFAQQLALGTGEFEAAIETRLAELGSSLTPTDIANRARFAGACIGCHQQSNGADLGGGVIAPFSAGFTHTAEFQVEPCGDGQVCFGISDALESSFLPHRKQVMEEFLAQVPCGDLQCGAPEVQPLSPADVPQVLLHPGGEVDIDAMIELERQTRAQGASRTVGGQSTLATH